MDQSVVAGLGNVYRAELLFRAGIHPLRPGRRLDRDTIHSLWATAVEMLRAGARTGRIETVDRADLGLGPRQRIPPGEGTYVYHREHCLRCGGPVRTVEIAGRTCFYCPTDQAV
jgi:endonuclease VIII